MERGGLPRRDGLILGFIGAFSFFSFFSLLLVLFFPFGCLSVYSSCTPSLINENYHSEKKEEKKITDLYSTTTATVLLFGLP